MASLSIGLNRNVHLLSTCIFRQMQSRSPSSRCILTPHYRSITSSAPVCAKYHYVKKKRKLKTERRELLEARLEIVIEMPTIELRRRWRAKKMDPEDRPTGCLLCPKQGDIEIDYKNVRLLSQFVSPHTGRIYSKEATGLCMFKQNEIKKAIRRSRSLGYMPYTMKYLSLHQDPKLF